MNLTRMLEQAVFCAMVAAIPEVAVHASIIVNGGFEADAAPPQQFSFCVQGLDAG